MKKLLTLSAIFLLGSVLSANAQTSWPIVVYTGTAVEHTTPLATMTVTRTPNASGTWDSLELRLDEWLLPAYQTGGLHGVGTEINSIKGIFTVAGSASPLGISIPGSMYATTWNFYAGIPTLSAPQSYVNMENTAGTFTRTGTSPNYTSLAGAWYTLTSGESNISVEDYALEDLKDQTLFAKFYVAAGTDLTFVADPGNGFDGVGTDNQGTSYWSFTTAVPEPGTVALLSTGLFGLLCYAWRKRK